jgi:acetyl esterase/lipase
MGKLPLRRALVVGLIVLTFRLAGLAPAAAPPARKQPEAAKKPYKVKSIRDITYYTVPRDPDASRHRLDVYRPTGRGRFPVLFFVHGGAWMYMSKDDVLGLLGYGVVARCLAEQGLVVVVPNYRLSPAVKHPEHVKDVARAFAWTYRNIHKHSGDVRSLFVGGHSAGGHLAALLATDETWLKQVGRSRKDIRGVIAVSGVYRVDDLGLRLSLGALTGTVSAKMDVRPLSIVFGDKKAAWQASPLKHIGPGLPPFLLLNGGWDYAPLSRMAKEFAAGLKKSGCPVEAKVVPWRTHESLLFDIPRLAADRTTVEAIVRFIARNKR